MAKRANLIIIVLCMRSSLSKDPELPPCPTNINYFPQILPMHCRMTRSANVPSFPNQIPTLPPILPPFYQSPPADKQPEPIPIPMPPGMSAMPPGMPGMPPGMPGVPFPMPMPIPSMGMPPMPMMPMQPPAHKLPVIVMPFYSPDPSFKKSPGARIPPLGVIKRKIAENKRKRRRRKPYYSDTDYNSDTETESDTSTDTSSDTSTDDGSSDNSFWKSRNNFRRNLGRLIKNKRKKHSKRRHNLLTPVLQYVTKDGYVIFEKKISNGEAKDWLKMKSGKNNKVIQNTKDLENDKEEENSSTNIDVGKVVIENNKDNDIVTDDVEIKTQRNPVANKQRPHRNAIKKKNNKN